MDKEQKDMLLADIAKLVMTSQALSDTSKVLSEEIKKRKMIRISEEAHRQLSIYKGLYGVTLEEAAEEAIMAYIGPKNTARTGVPFTVIGDSQ